MIRSCIITCLALLATITSHAQNKSLVPDLEELIKADNYAQAATILKDRVPQLFLLNKPDTLILYPKYIGKVTAKLNGDEAAMKAVAEFAEKAHAAQVPPKTLLRVYMEAAIFYSLKGKNDRSYKAIQDARQYVATLLKTDVAEDALLQAESGVYAYRMGNIGLSGHHHRTATHLLETITTPNYERLYNSYNNVGTIMWFASKIDSGIYYFDKAIAALSKMDNTPENKNYRVAIVQNNIAQLYNQQGNTTQAIHTMEAAILNMKTFLATKEPHPKKEFATIRQYEFIENLARIYREMGDFAKAQTLLMYSYQQKLKTFNSNSPEIYKAVINLGSLYYEQRDLKKGLAFLQEGLKRVYAEPTPSPLWAGEASNAVAHIYEAMENVDSARHYYELTDSLYEVSYGGEYDDAYMEFLRASALFYAKHQQQELAVTKAKKGLDYITRSQGAATLPAFQQLLNLSQVYYDLGNYQASLDYSNKGLAVVNKRIAASTVLLDSIKAELSKPDALLAKTRAEYHLLPEQDTAGVRSLLQQLDEALTILQRKRSVINDPADITILMAQNKELLDFIKELELKLYDVNHDAALIDRVIDQHENAIYNRIRSRLDKQKAVRFASLPADIQQQEAQLQQNITNALQSNRGGNNFPAYLEAVHQWQSFQELLRNQYPRYYNMRYASNTHQSIAELQKLIPAGTTVVRYIYVGEKLYALVADATAHHWVALANVEEETIRQLTDPAATSVAVSAASFQLYARLWEPLQSFIHTNRVIVIPDGKLYYVSFDMLSTRLATTYPELIANSLLNKYAISYHYSLFALAPKHAQRAPRSNFAAFVPAFSDEVKDEYRSALKTDTLRADNEYLSLLPLPFSVDLARSAQRRLGGNLFIGEQSTPAAFRMNAGNNSIIHIGTHAEANNEFPEYSRLIFAKDLEHGTDSNSVFLFDIYNYDLGSDLAVLTACETGKPGFFDGEGMISMAHAFNYAGSESILTGLWKIDEQASSIITGYFYENLQAGLSKDVALQKAKLKYLASAEGRMLAPQYWAGLVIMGDISPVPLEKKRSSLYWWAAGGLLLVLLTLIFFRRRRNY